MPPLNNTFKLQWLLLIFIAASCYGFDSTKTEVTKQVNIKKGFAIVELFTSEGCSSCPPADRLIDKLVTEKGSEIYILSYHIDYWDHIGWKDPFSQAAFTNRQRQYGRHFSLESIYTPQVIVNGIDEFVGSDERKLRASITANSTLRLLILKQKEKTIQL